MRVVVFICVFYWVVWSGVFWGVVSLGNCVFFVYGIVVIL